MNNNNEELKNNGFKKLVDENKDNLTLSTLHNVQKHVDLVPSVSVSAVQSRASALVQSSVPTSSVPIPKEHVLPAFLTQEQIQLLLNHCEKEGGTKEELNDVHKLLLATMSGNKDGNLKLDQMMNISSANDKEGKQKLDQIHLLLQKLQISLEEQKKNNTCDSDNDLYRMKALIKILELSHDGLHFVGWTSANYLEFTTLLEKNHKMIFYFLPVIGETKISLSLFSDEELTTHKICKEKEYKQFGFTCEEFKPGYEQFLKNNTKGVVRILETVDKTYDLKAFRTIKKVITDSKQVSVTILPGFDILIVVENGGVFMKNLLELFKNTKMIDPKLVILKNICDDIGIGMKNSDFN